MHFHNQPHGQQHDPAYGPPHQHAPQNAPPQQPYHAPYQPPYQPPPAYQPSQQESGMDTRGRTTGWIWFWAMVMMGPSVPISYITQSAVVPILVVVGAMVSSINVWKHGAKQLRRDQADAQALQAAHYAAQNVAEENARLRQHVGAMEDRLFALETMDSYERAAARRAAEQSAMQQNAAQQSAAQAQASFSAPSPSHADDSDPFATDSIERDPLLPLSVPQNMASPRPTRGRGPGMTEG